MVNKKIKSENNILEDKENSCVKGNIFIQNCTSLKRGICEMKNTYMPFSLNGTELNHNNALCDFNRPRHMSSQSMSIGEHFAEYHNYINDHKNQTPLHLAVIYNCWEVLEQQVRCGADVNSIDLAGYTPLHLAASYGNFHFTNILLQNGANPKIKTHEGFGALYLAVRFGCPEVIELLVKSGCDINEMFVDKDLDRQYSYLHIAVERNYTMMVQTLLKCNIDVNLRDCYGSTSLHFASRDGRLNIARLLLDHGASVNIKDQNNLTALYFAVDAGHKDIFQLLLDYGANLNDRGIADASLLHLAVRHSDMSFVGILLNKGANVDAATRFGQTALHYSIIEKNWSAMLMLLDHGANVNYKEIRGKTPLHSAIEYRRKEIFEILLKYGADVNAKDSKQQTPLHLATKEHCSDTVQLLLQYGAYINAEDENQQTSLHLAVKFGYIEIFEVLLKYQVNVNVIDSEGFTPLHLAVSEFTSFSFSDYTYFIVSLLHNGADVDIKVSTTGETALHMAVKRRRPVYVKKLLRSNADINSEDNIKRKTALHIAVENGYHECVELLLAFGADYERFDINGKTALDMRLNDEIKSIFARHFVKKLVAGMPVNSDLIKLVFNENNDLAVFRDRCAGEINLMQATNLDDEITYFDFLRGTRRSLVNFIRNPKIYALLEYEKDYKTMFPNYADMLEKKLAKAKFYEPILDVTEERLNALCNYELPDVPMQRILNYMNKKDMKTLFAAVPTLPIIFGRKNN